jgi:uncharacterized membrane protein
MRRALQIILWLSLAGAAFSGTLSYQELCGRAGGTCSAAGAQGMLLGYPACVYGLVMYIGLAVVAALGLRAKQ